MGLPTPKMPLPGYRLIADNAGSYIDDVNNIRLSNKFTLTRNTADPSAAIDIDLSVVGAGFQPLDADLTAIAALTTTAYGRALLTLANQAALVALLPNSGVSEGRLNVPIQVDRQTPSAASSYSTPAITGGAYKKIILDIRGIGGMTVGAPATMQFNGDTGSNYWSASMYVQGSASVAGNAPGTNGANTSAQLCLTAGNPSVDVDLHIEIDPTVITSCARHFTCSFVSKGSSDATGIHGDSRGFWKNTTDEITGITVNFGAAFTGIVDVKGIPA